jgi:geranylgeranyl pyrophosphate synthase
MILNRYAYRELYTRPMPNETRAALSEAMDRLIESVSSVAASEIEYTSHEFADQAYLELARTKTSCYTRHALQLGSSLAGGAAATNELLARIGNHLGASLQLLDDALDAVKDSTGDHAATLATVLTQRGQSLKAIFDLSGQEIRSALDVAASLPFPATLSGSLQRAGSFLRFLQ